MEPEFSERLPEFITRESVAPLVGTKPTRSLVAYPSTVEECRETIAFCKRNALTLCPRGSGHSYGDMVLNDSNLILNTTRMDRILAFEESSGRIVVQPGVKIIDVFRKAHPQLFTLPASPSEAIITVAGAIANNVNGKDSWKVGNFGDQVLHMKLLTADGEILSVDRVKDREVFRAVVGGMGMLGIIVEATLQLQRIASPFLETSRVSVGNVRELLARLARTEKESDFAVVWVDAHARGAKLGRGVVHSTRWSRPDDTDGFDEAIASGLERLGHSRGQALALHNMLNYVITAMLHFQRISVRVFNKAYFVFCALRNRLPFVSQVELFIEYNFFPNLQIPPAQMLCGPGGYTIQIVFPRTDAEAAITEMLEICQRIPCRPVTTIMRLHRADDNLISFSADGYSLNFEFHPKKRHPSRMQPGINALIDCAVRFEGKVHLAKDMILSREQFRRLFPRYEVFVEIKRRLDPDQLFSSDLYRRLLVDETHVSAKPRSDSQVS